MKKLIILTTSIIRGDFHKKTIGKFYEYFNDFLLDYKITHIINIDEPKNLQNYFNKYETIFNYYQIMPKNVNIHFICTETCGFLEAFKNLISKIEELNLVNDDYLYYWLEDDWEPKEKYNISKLFDIFNYKNTSYSITKHALLGSFRGGPFMTGSYFKNIFNIKKYMNDTCDPERQMQRWIKNCNYYKDQNYVYRLSVKNKNIDNSVINIIYVFKDHIQNKNLTTIKNEINMYKNARYNKNIIFKFHVIIYDIDYNLKYSEYNNNFKYENIKLIEINKLHEIFDNLYIKHFNFYPYIMYDLGREFNTKYLLNKWNKSNNNSTTYNIINFCNIQIGNENLLDESILRYNPRLTENMCFFTSLGYIHQCLPYLKKHYFDNNIYLNILYYSHLYGKYPNFNVFSDIIQLNYNVSINNDKLFKTLSIYNIFENISNNNSELLYNNNFELANKYFFDYFKFDESIYDEVNKFTYNFEKKNMLGIHYETSEDNKTKNNFLQIIDNHLINNNYNYIFIFTNDETLLEYLIQKYNNIIYYDNNFYFNELSFIKNNIFSITKQINNMKIKKKQGSLHRASFYEHRLKQKSIENRKVLKNNIINSLILSKCNFVLKTNSQLSAYSKVFNPDLNIYKINLYKQSLKEWPESAIPFYE